MKKLTHILAFVSVFSVVPTFAQKADAPDLAVERFRIAQDRGGILDVEWGAITTPKSWSMGVWLGFSDNIIVVRDNGMRVGSLVGSRLSGDVTLSYGLSDWIQIGAAFPLIATQGSDTIPGAPASDPSAGLGDIAFLPKIRILQQRKHFLSMAFIPGITLPTASAADLGEAGISLEPEVIASRAFGPIRVAANLGYKTRTRRTLLNLVVDDEVTFRVGAAIRLRRHSKLPIEVGGSFSNHFGIEGLTRTGQSGMEMKAAVTMSLPWDFQIVAGGGLGLVEGYGTPDWRAFLSFRSGKSGIDRDGDGIWDRADRCINIPEDHDQFEDSDGCPEENSRFATTIPDPPQADPEGLAGKDPSSKEPKAGEGPVAAKDPKAGKEPAASKDPKAVKEPVASKDPKAVKEPVASKDPKASRDPFASKNPNTSKEPKSSKDPKVVKEPVASRDPKVVKEPVASKDPKVVKEPVASKDPKVVKEPVASKDPKVVKEPVASKDPKVVKEPVASKDPAVVKEPVASKDPKVVKEPVASKDPAETKKAVVKIADLDPDLDGFANSIDKCPTEPETVNHYNDYDGCPDVVPLGFGRGSNKVAGRNYRSSSSKETVATKTGESTVDTTVEPTNPTAYIARKRRTQASDRPLNGLLGFRSRDDDGDGVSDADDYCPGQKGMGQNNGCSDLPSIVVRRNRLLNRVQFSVGSSDIHSRYKIVLDDLVMFLKSHKELSVLIEGHTDSISERSVDIQLSQSRAAAVKKYLLSKGIPSKRIEAVGFGFDRLLSPDTSKSGRSKNRRVEFLLYRAR